MYRILFKNRFYALLFVVVTLFGVRELVGTEDREGALGKAVATIEEKKPESLTVGPREMANGNSGGSAWDLAPGGSSSSADASSEIVVPVPVGAPPVPDGPVGGPPGANEPVAGLYGGPVSFGDDRLPE